DDGVVDLLLIWRERPGWLACRDNGVVVTHLLFVDDSPGEGEGTEVEFSDLGRFERPELVQDPGYLSLQIAAEVARVGPGVGYRLPLVERLGRLERGVGREAEAPVHVALQLGQVVELRRLGPLLLPLHTLDDERLALHPTEERPRVLLLREAVAGELEGDLAVAGQELPEGFRFEGADLIVTVDDHGKDRRLHAPDAPEDPA